MTPLLLESSPTLEFQPGMNRFLTLFLICTVAVLPSPTFAKDKVVRVFILAGQSNMEGHGRIAGEQKGTLETVSRDPATATRYRDLHRNGKWITRKDVWRSTANRSSSVEST